MPRNVDRRHRRGREREHTDARVELVRIADDLKRISRDYASIATLVDHNAGRVQSILFSLDYAAQQLTEIIQGDKP